jgi:hypothetical protein
LKNDTKAPKDKTLIGLANTLCESAEVAKSCRIHCTQRQLNELREALAKTVEHVILTRQDIGLLGKIPSCITKPYILEAIKQIDKNGTPPKRRSRSFDLIDKQFKSGIM